MVAYAGPAPWYQGVSETYKNGRRKPRLVSGNQEWNLSEGWHAKRQAGWYNKPSKRKGQTVTKQTLIGLHGEDIEVYDSKGYKDEIGFNARNNEDAEAYASNALNKPNVEDVKIDKGHIKRIEYTSREQVMRVTFWNDAKVIYFRVPTACAGMLLHFAKDNYEVAPDKETGRSRHVLGVAFWNYVRIRGQIHGSRYPFQYEQHGVYKLTGSNKLYRVKLTEDNFEKILGRKYNGALKPGDVIETPLSEEQYALYDEARTLDDNTRSIEENKFTAMDYDTNADGEAVKAEASFENELVDRLDRELYNNNRQAPQAELVRKDPLTKEEADELRNLIAELKTGRNQAKKDLYDKRKESSSAFNDWKNAHKAEYEDLLRQENERLLKKGQADQIAWRKAALDFYEGETEGMNINKLADRLKRATRVATAGIDNMRGYVGLDKDEGKLYGRASNILEDRYGRYVELMRKAAAPHFANNMSRRVWTKDDLYKMTDPVIMPDNNQRAVYKAYLAIEDWNGALNFLKNHQGPAQRWDQRTGKLITYNRKSETYAGNSDILDI